MKKRAKLLLFLLSALCALSLLFAGCAGGRENGGASSSARAESSESAEEGVQSGDEGSGQPQTGETSSVGQSEEENNSSSEQSSESGGKLPGGLVDMGNFESRQ